MAAHVDLTVPGVFSFLCLAVVFVLHFSFVLRGVSLGQMGRLQFYACVASLISNLGTMSLTLGAYEVHEDNPGCEFEAWTMSFGELAVILWMMCNSVYCICCLTGTLPSWLFSAFHVFVWTVSGVLTVVPGLLDLYGLQEWDGQRWCWFREGEVAWEIGQFYAPLLLANLLSVVTFTWAYNLISTVMHSYTDFLSIDEEGESEAREAAGDAAFDPYAIDFRFGRPAALSTTAPPSPSPSPDHEVGVDVSAVTPSSPGGGGETDDAQLIRLHRRRLWHTFVRLALQNAVLFVVFMPDAIMYLIDLDSDEEDQAKRQGLNLITEILWKMEGVCLAALYLSNSIVQRELRQRLWYRKLCARLSACWYCCTRCGCRPQRQPLATQMATPAGSSAGLTESLLERPPE